jgi:hypothetical protein
MVIGNRLTNRMMTKKWVNNNKSKNKNRKIQSLLKQKIIRRRLNE